MSMAEPGSLTGERADLVEALDRHRFFLRQTVRDLTDEQAARHTTVSELCLGGLIKHVTATERRWAEFIRTGPAAMAPPGDADAAQWQAGFRMEEGETLAGLLADYDSVASHTDDLVRTLPDLDASQPLPEAPWFPPVGPEGAAAHHRRDRAARRACRHHPRVPGWCQDHGLTGARAVGPAAGYS